MSASTVLITGAGSGIGLATARLLVEHGYQLSLSTRSLHKVKEFEGMNGVTVFPCDVRDYAQVKTWIDFARAQHGSVDVLINNAGLGFFDPLVEGKIEEWHEMVDTNIKGVLNCLHASMPHLLESADPRVINIASVAAHAVFPNSGVYCATKHAVLAISDSIRTELAARIKTTTISPGAVSTAFIESTTNEEMKSGLRDYFATGMSPELIAYQILHSLQMPADAVISEIIIRPHREQKK
jgi:NADP-dependent 3-hydroxy acid dehydrogenase YdfG